MPHCSVRCSRSRRCVAVPPRQPVRRRSRLRHTEAGADRLARAHQRGRCLSAGQQQLAAVRSRVALVLQQGTDPGLGAGVARQQEAVQAQLSRRLPRPAAWHGAGRACGRRSAARRLSSSSRMCSICRQQVVGGGFGRGAAQQHAVARVGMVGQRACGWKRARSWQTQTAPSNRAMRAAPPGRDPAAARPAPAATRAVRP